MEALPLALDKIYQWEKSKRSDVYLTQPIPGRGPETYTWGEAVGQARKMAAYLKSLDLPESSNIAIISKNCAHWLIADMAIWMAGHVSVPIYPTANQETISHVLDHCEAQALFIGKLDDWDSQKRAVPKNLLTIAMPLFKGKAYQKWDHILKDYAPIKSNPRRKADDVATIIYTSGSTGVPKGVVHTFKTMAYASIHGDKEMNVTDQDRMLSYLPLAHVFERWVVELNSYYSGFQVYFAESLDTFVDDLRRAQPTIFVAVPRIWSKFQLSVFEKISPTKLSLIMAIPILGRVVKKKILSQMGLDHCRFAASGSAPLAASTLRWYRKLGLDLLEGYGMSENFGYSNFTRPGESKIGYVGTPNPEVIERISATGEIEVKSPTNMLGYYKDPQKTAETFTRDGYLKTGDVGYIDQNGKLKITGRIKDTFKTSKGKYIVPARAENILDAHPYIEMSCVSGNGQPQPFAMVQLSEHQALRWKNANYRKEIELTLTMLREEVNKVLESHERIQFIAVVNEPWTIESGYLTPTMKLKRHVIENEYNKAMEDWYQTEKKVVAI